VTSSGRVFHSLETCNSKWPITDGYKQRWRNDLWGDRRGLGSAPDPGAHIQLTSHPLPLSLWYEDDTTGMHREITFERRNYRYWIKKSSPQLGRRLFMKMLWKHGDLWGSDISNLNSCLRRRINSSSSCCG